MSATYFIQNAFAKGEISPLLGARADIEEWRQSLYRCLNYRVLPQGGIQRRSGTVFVAELKSSSAVARLFPFKFSEDQAYVLALNGGAIRFYAQRGVLGSPYEVAHSYADADLAKLGYAQFNDVAYSAHGSYAPKKLSRLGDVNWTLASAVFRDGPYLDASTSNDAYATLTPSDYGSLTPAMTSNTAPAGTVTDFASNTTAYKAFDKNKSSWPTEWNGTSGWVQYQLASGSAVVDNYYVTSSDTASTAKMPISWRVEGSNDGSTFVTLDVRDGETGWGGAETRFYSFDNQTAYSIYRFTWLSTADTGNVPNTRIAEIGFNKAAASQTAFTLTASSTAAINGGSGFQSSDVGRLIHMQGSDGEWRWATIKSVTSTTEVTITTNGPPFPDLSPISLWALGAWSDESGWPSSVGLYQQRLIWAANDSKPSTIWGSKSGIFDDYGISPTVKGTDGLNLTLLSAQMNRILWISEDQDMFVGSAGQIRSLGPNDVTQAFSATNVTQRKGPTSGAAYLQPISIGGTTIFVGAGRNKIMELLVGDQNRYIATDVSILSQHLFKQGIVDWAYSERPSSETWIVTGDGKLVSFTFDRDQKIVGFARHDVGGFVENVAVIPSVTEGFDDVYFVVKRTVNGETKRYIEVMEIPFDWDLHTLEESFFVDCGLKYSGTAITTITGLSHLEGEDVIALADGGYVDGLTVSGGSVTLPYAASKISIGLPFASDAVTLPISGQQADGTLFGRRRQVTAAFVDVLASGALEVGPWSDSEDWTPELYEALLKRGDSVFGEPVELTTGFVRCDYDASWAQGGGMMRMYTDKPFPALVRAFVFQTESEP